MDHSTTKRTITTTCRSPRRRRFSQGGFLQKRRSNRTDCHCYCHRHCHHHCPRNTKASLMASSPSRSTRRKSLLFSSSSLSSSASASLSSASSSASIMLLGEFCPLLYYKKERSREEPTSKSSLSMLLSSSNDNVDDHVDDHDDEQQSFMQSETTCMLDVSECEQDDDWDDDTTQPRRNPQPPLLKKNKKKKLIYSAGSLSSNHRKNSNNSNDDDEIIARIASQILATFGNGDMSLAASTTTATTSTDTKMTTAPCNPPSGHDLPNQQEKGPNTKQDKTLPPVETIEWMIQSVTNPTIPTMSRNSSEDPNFDMPHNEIETPPSQQRQHSRLPVIVGNPSSMVTPTTSKCFSSSALLRSSPSPSSSFCTPRSLHRPRRSKQETQTCNTSWNDLDDDTNDEWLVPQLTPSWTRRALSTIPTAKTTMTTTTTTRNGSCTAAVPALTKIHHTRTTHNASFVSPSPTSRICSTPCLGLGQDGNHTVPFVSSSSSSSSSISPPPCPIHNLPLLSPRLKSLLRKELTYWMDDDSIY